jgi:hypothetical protein
MTAEQVENVHYYRSELPYLRVRKTIRCDTFILDEFELEARGETMNEALEGIYRLSKLLKNHKVLKEANKKNETVR